MSTEPWAQGTEDIGHGVRIDRRYIDGKLHGVAYYHPGKNGAECAGYVGVDSSMPGPHWDLVSEQPLTLSPSLLCRGCGHHGFIRDGRWVPC